MMMPTPIDTRVCRLRLAPLQDDVIFVVLVIVVIAIAVAVVVAAVINVHCSSRIIVFAVLVSLLAVAVIVLD